jgi:integrase
VQPEQITVNSILDYLQERTEKISANNGRDTAYTIRNFLTSPPFAGKLSFDPIPLLSGFRFKKNERLKSWFTTDELKAVMDAVDRTSKWGKTIYAMMLLACIYGLRVSDIREMLISSINWKEHKITLFQKKTRKYIELPLTVAAKFALLDYYKNVRPASSDPHLFIKHLHPHTPYSSYVNFGSKVAIYFKKAGVDTTGKHHGLHSMRFSLATELLAEGVSIDEISSILGHKKIAATKGYVWSDIKHLKAAALEVPVYGSR